MMNSVRLIENFVTWQGEGPDSGKRMVLLRFKTCNRTCPWCDTAVKMRVSAEAEYTIEDIQKQIKDNNAGLMITGGEPTVDRHFDETVFLLNALDYSIANVETNGYRLFDLVTCIDSVKNINYILSPKIFSKKDLEFYIKMAVTLGGMPNVFIKMVYEGTRENDEFLTHISSFFPSNRLWLMPEGTIKDVLIRNSEKVFDVCEKYNCNFSSRNHIIYGFI